jgi:hypothetical protein
MCNAKTRPMRKIKTILTLLFALNFFVAFAHKDRIERPKTYQFIFQNKDTIRLDNPNDSILKAYSDDIVYGKRKLVNAELFFATGETMTFKNDGKKWTEMIITDGKKVISIPDTTIEKISEIHFATIALLWNGDDKQAFGASYFYIRFDIGTGKYFSKYPELSLSFSGQKFSKAIVWRQITENSEQWKDF